MTHHIPNPIVLDPALPRCKPHRGCPRSAGCASFLVKDAPGRPVCDYTISVNGWDLAKCTGWRDVAQHRPVPNGAAPTVHDTPNGLL